MLLSFFFFNGTPTPDIYPYGHTLSLHDALPSALQAAIAACHARATRAKDTDWPRIVALYGTLAQRYPSPVVELNRAVAISMASGAEAGLSAVDALLDEHALRDYHLLPSVRGELRSEEHKSELQSIMRKSY